MYTSTIFSSGVSPRGLGQLDYPWRQFSENTRVLQVATNRALKAHGYCPIAEDGKLGPGTCGAVREMLDYVEGQFEPPGECEGFTVPRKPPCPGAAPRPTIGPLLAHEPYMALRKKPLSMSTMVMGGTVVLAVGVLGYAIAKKKGLIK